MHAVGNVPLLHLTPEKGFFGDVGNKVGVISWLYVMFPFSLVSVIRSGVGKRQAIVIIACLKDLSSGDTCLCVFTVIQPDGVSLIGPVSSLLSCAFSWVGMMSALDCTLIIRERQKTISVIFCFDS